MSDRSRRLALISVSDKDGLIGFARTLIEHGYELVSTGGTHRAIRDAGLAVTAIDAVTGFPEMMDGRVKTLHPKVHGGILALRDDEKHAASMREHSIAPIDIVCVNLYPFEQTVARQGVTEPEAIEQIDIGGPSMVRSAAKNFRHVAIVTDPKQYGSVAEDLDRNNGSTSVELRRALAVSAFERTSTYDNAIFRYLSGNEPADEVADRFPSVLEDRFTLNQTLRYGENPHQRAAVYAAQGDASGPDLVRARQLSGKDLSYNNLNDCAGALAVTRDLSAAFPDRVGASVIKHTNPCGVAVATDARHAIELALAGDPLAAYGGILSVNATIDADAASWLAANATFFEVIAAPAFEKDAAAALGDRWKNVRLLELGANREQRGSVRTVRSVPGGVLVQDADDAITMPQDWKHVAGPSLDEAEADAALLVWLACKHLTSNAIAIGGFDAALGGVRLFGGGAGQMDRVASCELAIRKAGDLSKIRTPIAASDAFFPFADGPEKLIDSGVKALVHPGGSKRDSDTIELCTARGVTCLITGTRHFRH
ncbi:MAG: bifunctional phosphoribosylaminoimidazolecarboxamide formyltransferase/IMP cyclohydrolase [bacterium]|nr:bifunctional phosphoribosylaminoimidazolecarboxamide formyltransferase/IMP cyclohydrolase [bacterium]